MTPNNTPSTMNVNEINARRAANEFVNAPTHRVNTVDKHGNESSAPAWGLDMAESIAAHKRATFPNDKTEIITTGATEYATETTAPESPEPSHAETIARRIEAMKPRGAWENGVKEYALMLLDWYETEANESPLTLETMLNGAKDWQQYARGGAGVAQCYNARIAETLCSPSELKRNNHGAKNPNRFEDWQDVEARALFQAWQLITDAETNA